MSTRTLVEGTSGDDAVDLTGTLGPYEIVTYGGNDTVRGGDGGDIVDAGPGHDYVNGGSGDDTIIAGSGIDQIHGGAGTDLLRASAGDDLIGLLTWSSLEAIDGGSGQDTISGGNANNYWDFSGIALTGIELIDLGGGWNRFTGSAADERITAAGKDDVIDGGGGFDAFLFNRAYAEYTLKTGSGSVTVSGPQGTDTFTNVERLVFTDGTWENGSFTPTGEQPANGAPVAQNDAYTTTEGDALTFDPLANDSDPDGDTLQVAAMGAAANGTVALVSGQWTYTPDAGFTGTESWSYTITDGALQDSATVSVTVESDGTSEPPPSGSLVLVEGTSGDDTIDLSAQTVPHEVRAYGGNDIITGSQAGDLINAGYGHDNVDAGAGNDTIISGAGIDQYHGGSGTDLLKGSGGSDYIRILTWSGLEAIDGGSGQDTIAAGNGNERWDFSGVTLTSIELIDLGGGWNRFVGSGGDDRITAAGKDDIIDGGGGTDSFLFNRTFAEYDLSVSGSTITVSGPQGKDTFTRVEKLVFTDGTWSNGTFTSDDGSTPNGAPVAENDSYATTEGQSLVFDPLTNDSDPDGDTISVADMQQPDHGTVALVNGQWTYTPAAGFTGTDTFGYTITDGSLQSSASISVAVNSAPTGGGGGGGGGGDGIVISQALWDKLSVINEGGWGRLNDNRFSWVAPEDSDYAQYGYQRSVIQAWSSMAWDSNRNDLILWGGGHANYSGNEVYRFDSDTLMWERASLPSRIEPTARTGGYETVDGPDNAPISSHTYDNSEFLPIADRFMTFGGAAYNTGGGFVYTADDGTVTKTGPYFWNPALADANKVGGLDGSGIDPARAGGRMWENRDANAQNPYPGSVINGTSAYAEINGKDVMFLSNYTGLWQYTVHDPADASKDTMEKIGGKWAPYDGAGTGVYDSLNNLFVRSANGQFLFWDLDKPGSTNVNFTPTDLTGGFKMDAHWAMDYDEARDRILLWKGNEDVWELDAPETIGSSGWTVKKLPTAASTEEPDIASYRETQVTTGILGKWKYIDDLDIYLGIYDHYKGNVWAYKPSDWDPNVALA